MADPHSPCLFTMKHLIPAALLGSALALSAPAFADEAAQMALGKKLFGTATPACALCHTLKDAGAEGPSAPCSTNCSPMPRAWPAPCATA